MSLGFQRDDCLRYAQTRSITITKVFEERGESGKFANRPELLAMIDYCRKNKKSIGAAIVWKLDRLSRNQMDYYFIKRNLWELDITLHSATEPSLDDGSSLAGRVFETFSALQAEIENTVRRERTVRGMEAKIMAGIYPRSAPLGYLPVPARDGARKVEPDEPDPERFSLIQKLFRNCLDEHVCGSAELTIRANAWGLRTRRGKKLYPQKIDRILENKFYAGILHNPWRGEDVTGKHKPVVTPEEFHRVQWLRKGRRAAVPLSCRGPEHPDFPLRRTIRCAFCSGPLTGGWSRGNGGRYAYYNCAARHCSARGKAIPKAMLERAFLEKLHEITPKPSYLAGIMQAVADVWAEQAKTTAESAVRQRRRLKELEEIFDGLIAMKARNLLSDDEFKGRKERLAAEIAEARAVVNEPALSKAELDELIAYGRRAIEDLPATWYDLVPETRRRFEEALFPLGIRYARQEGFRTTKYGCIYEISRQSKGSFPRLVTLTGESSNRLLHELAILSNKVRIFQGCEICRGRQH